MPVLTNKFFSRLHFFQNKFNKDAGIVLTIENKNANSIGARQNFVSDTDYKEYIDNS